MSYPGVAPSKSVRAAIGCGIKHDEDVKLTLWDLPSVQACHTLYLSI